MDERSPKNEHKHVKTLFAPEEFVAHFDNFHLIFATEDKPFYLQNIKKFLQERYTKEFEEITREFKTGYSLGKETPEILNAKKDLLYRIYLALRQEGKFSNEELGLKYW